MVIYIKKGWGAYVGGRLEVEGPVDCELAFEAPECVLFVIQRMPAGGIRKCVPLVCHSDGDRWGCG